LSGLEIRTSIPSMSKTSGGVFDGVMAPR